MTAVIKKPHEGAPAFALPSSSSSLSLSSQTNWRVCSRADKYGPCRVVPVARGVRNGRVDGRHRGCCCCASHYTRAAHPSTERCTRRRYDDAVIRLICKMKMCTTSDRSGTCIVTVFLCNILSLYPRGRGAHHVLRCAKHIATKCITLYIMYMYVLCTCGL